MRLTSSADSSSATIRISYLSRLRERAAEKRLQLDL